MAIVSGTGLPQAALAEACPVAPFEYAPAAPITDDPQSPITADADRIVNDNGIISLDGNTSLQYQGREITSEQAQYNSETGELTIDGALTLRGEGLSVDSSGARFELNNNTFSSGESRYELDLNGRRATGEADRMVRRANGEFLLDGATYSSCPPNDKSWQIRASRIELFPDTGIGTARNIRLDFKGVPIFAIPAFSFPISPARKTGFLAPVLARGEQTGLELQLPWYWNFRPNLDATFTPRLMSERGAQLKTELRYLNEQGFWTVDSEYLRDTDRDGMRRSFLQLQHQGDFSRRWSSEINASHVSDDDYFDDLGDSLQLASITHLERRAEIRYNDTFVQGLARLQSFQTIGDSAQEAATDDDDADNTLNLRPYRRLPQLVLQATAPSRPFGLIGKVDTEFVHFDRSNSITGTRFDIQPGVTLPLGGNAWFFEPSIKHRFTHYELDRSDVPQTAEDAEDPATTTDSPNRSLPIFSVDTGLFFDRLLDDSGTVQTLEPRLYYLNVPFEDQEELPNFDTSAFDFNIAQLFRENRFSGADKLADANQLSLALTSRFINGGDGRELLRGSIGQILYFDDRKVTLSEASSNTGDVSDLVGEVSAEIIKHWVAKGGIQWNPDNQETVRGSLLLSYRPVADKILNIGHRSISDGSLAETEQLDISAIWPVSDQWRLAGRWNYSLDTQSSIETLLGLEYESCCWAFRFAARRYISDDEDHDTSLYLQLVLKGLAPLGQNYGGVLENAILGYRDDYE